MAGRDATRFLARTSLEEETADEATRILSPAERAALTSWKVRSANMMCWRVWVDVCVCVCVWCC